MSSTMRNMTGHTLYQYPRHGKDSLSLVSPDMPLAMSAYGGRPVSSSITVHPKDQMSDLGEAPFNSMTSGAIQFGVPATSFISRSIARKFKETPKSESLTLPVLVVRMLAALRSQWTTSLRWR